MLYHPPGLASPTELKMTRNIYQNRLPEIDDFRCHFRAWNWSSTYQKMYSKPDHPKWTFVLYFIAINVVCYVGQKIGYWGHVVVKFRAKIRREQKLWLTGIWSHSDPQIHSLNCRLHFAVYMYRFIPRKDQQGIYVVLGVATQHINMRNCKTFGGSYVIVLRCSGFPWVGSHIFLSLLRRNEY